MGEDHNREEEGKQEHGQDLKIQRTRGYLEEEHDDAARDRFTEGRMRQGADRP